MKFTQEELRQLISEEIENYLNEQDDDEDHLFDREEFLKTLARLEAYIEKEEEQLRMRKIDPDSPTVGPTGTQIVDRLADTPVGEKPPSSSVARTQLIDPRN